MKFSIKRYKANQMDKHWVGEFGRVSGVLRRLKLLSSDSAIEIFGTIIIDVLKSLSGKDIALTNPKAYWWYEHLFRKEELINISEKLYLFIKNNPAISRKPKAVIKFLKECGWKI